MHNSGAGQWLFDDLDFSKKILHVIRKKIVLFINCQLLIIDETETKNSAQFAFFNYKLTFIFRFTLTKTSSWCETFSSALVCYTAFFTITPVIVNIFNLLK